MTMVLLDLVQYCVLFFTFYYSGNICIIDTKIDIEVFVSVYLEVFSQALKNILQPTENIFKM